MNTDEINCDVIKKFVETNKYPILKRLDNNYLTRLEKSGKIVVIATISRKDVTHVNFLHNFFHNIAYHKREYLFTYIDYIEDSYLLKFFNLNQDNSPKIIIYDFTRGRYNVFNYSLNEENSILKLNDLISNLDNGEIKWSTGYFIEDVLDSMGVRVSRNVLTVIFFSVIAIMGIVLMICLCQLLDRITGKIHIKKE